MRHVKAKDVKAGMLAEGHERWDFPIPARIVSVTRVNRKEYRITLNDGVETGTSDYPSNALFKIIR